MWAMIQLPEPLLAQLLDLREGGAAAQRKRGSALFSRDDGARNYFYVESGYVRISKPLPDGRELLMGVRTPGEMCGPYGLAGEGVNGLMLSDGIVHELSAVRVRELCERSPEMWRWLASLQARRTAELERRLEVLALPDVQLRLLAMLPDLARRCGETGADGVVTIPLKQEEVASLVGATRETTSTALNQFARRGLIGIKRGRLLLPSVSALSAAMAGRNRSQGGQTSGSE